MSEVCDKVTEGDINSAARLIRDIEDDIPGVKDILKELYPFTGNAYVIGITGAPGVGKSTLVDAMLSHLRREGKTVGVLAVDPTSPFSGGAILGDRIRMRRHALDDGVFIRSLATRGQFGGLARAARGAIDVLDAMGKDYIIVETVGVGQDEVDIAQIAQTTVVVVVPRLGDGIQAMKAGILEVGDIFLINKADNEHADRALNDLKSMLGMNQHERCADRWRPPVLKAQAAADIGVVEFMAEIEAHGQYLRRTSDGPCYRRSKESVRHDLLEMVKYQLIEDMTRRLENTGNLDRMVDLIAQGKTDPFTACEEIVLNYRAIAKSQ